MSKDKKNTSDDKSVLSSYFERQQDSTFYQVVKDLCILSVFTPKKVSGITVLYPSDFLLKQISELANSHKFDDVVKAREMIKSLVLKAKIKSNDDWHSYVSDCPNWLGQNVPVKIEASGKILVNGNEVSVDTQFRDTSEKQNLSVWLLSGEKGVGVNNPESKLKHDVGKDKVEQPQSNTVVRTKIMSMIENKVSRDLYAKNGLTGGYLDFTVDLLNYLKMNNATAYNRVLPLVSLDTMVDLYILLDPFGMFGGGKPLVEDSSIMGWWNSIQGRSLFTHAPTIFTDMSKLQSKREDMNNVLKSLRTDIECSGDCIKEIRNVYETLSKTNQLCNVSVFGPAFVEVMKVDPEYKLLVDQLKFAVSIKLVEMQSRNVPVYQQVETLSKIFEDYMRNRGRGRIRLLGLIQCRGTTLLDKTEEAELFYNTDYFLSNVGTASDKKIDKIDLENLCECKNVVYLQQYLTREYIRSFLDDASHHQENSTSTRSAGADP